MNIFATDPDPRKSAYQLDLKRVVKMILESYQLMSNAMWANGAQGFYRLSHKSHPCSLWIAESRANFQWVFQHAQALFSVYNLHYRRTHKCMEHFNTCAQYMHRGSFPSEAPTPHVNCTEFKSIQDVHKAYRFQMLKKWQQDKQSPKWPSDVNHVGLVNEWSQEYAQSVK
jgi:hypothetical protein